MNGHDQTRSARTSTITGFKRSSSKHRVVPWLCVHLRCVIGFQKINWTGKSETAYTPCKINLTPHATKVRSQIGAEQDSRYSVSWLKTCLSLSSFKHIHTTLFLCHFEVFSRELTSISIHCVICATSSWSRFPLFAISRNNYSSFHLFHLSCSVCYLHFVARHQRPMTFSKKKTKALFFGLMEWSKAQSCPCRPQSRQRLFAIQEAISESFCVQLQLCIQTTPSKLPRLWWNDAICLQGSNSCTARLNLAFPCGGLLIRASVSLLIVPSAITKALPNTQQEAGENRKWFVFPFRSVDCVQSGRLTNVENPFAAWYWFCFLLPSLIHMKHGSE